MASPLIREQIKSKWNAVFTRLNCGEQGSEGFARFTEAWVKAKKHIRPRPLNEPKEELPQAELKAIVQQLLECKMSTSFMEEFIEEMRDQQYLITNEIDQFMAQYEATSDPQYIARLVMRLSEWYQAWHPPSEVGTYMLKQYKVSFQTHVFSVLPPSFPRGFKSLIAVTFNLLHASTAPQWLLDVLPPHDPAMPRIDIPLWAAFEKLGFMDRYESLVSTVCHEHVEEYVLGTCEREWSDPMLASIREWMANKIVPWMVMPYARGARNADEARTMLQGVGSRLDFHLCKTLSDLRIREIFDIIVDYPDSTGALQDLKECLQRTDQRSYLVQALRKANKKRLLHPGADTKDILNQYVSIIRCLRIIDPPGVLLFKVGDPIRRYLRERPDTIRCIVASLVGDGESGDSLVDENEPIQPLQQAQADDYSDPNWEPEPIDAGPDFRANKPSDVISTLVSIYDSKELFVKELQVLLAQRLLAITDGNHDRERRNIEILKVRFGEAALQVCEVMLKDMADSRRTDQHIQAQKSSVLHSTIVSRHFWPPLQLGNFVMPPRLKAIQDEYSKEFTSFKPDKKLAWLPHLGTMKLEIELDDRTVEADVSPLEAAFIEYFSEQDIWTMDELISKVGSVDRSATLKALTTWVDLGVLKEVSPNTYRLLNVAEERSEEGPTAVQPSGSRSSIEDVPAVVTIQQQQAEQMQVFWKFIEGMLTNLGQLPLDRIQTMLKFAPGYDKNIEQLGAFMEAARREGLVTARDGIWRLNRP